MTDLPCGILNIRDSEVVPDINHRYNMERIITTARNFASLLDRDSLTEIRLWADFGQKGLPFGLVAEDPAVRGYAEWRLFRLADIARALETDKIVLPWTDETESILSDQGKNHLEGILSVLLDYDPGLTIILSREGYHSPGESSPDRRASNSVRAWSMTSRT